MSDTKWTPGPWKPHATGLARSGKPEHEIHWSDDGECIAEIVHGEPEANLIAAAPDLYEELEGARGTIQALIDEGYTGYIEHRGRIDAALAKARGES